jgi:hypothetical protein
MRARIAIVAMLVAAVAALVGTQALHAQAPARGRSAAAPGSAAGRSPANMAQLMRGILFPNSNVLFAAQSEDFLKMKPEGDPSLSTNPLTSVYGGWQAVENSALVLAESTALLTTPRACSNGKPAPVQNADWRKFVDGLRTAGLNAYKAAQAKNTEKFLDVSDEMTTACANCHDVYREKTDKQGGLAARCTK